MEKVVSLWGEELSFEETPLQNKELLKKASTKKEIKTTEKQLKSKKVSTEEKMILIEEDVNRILGKFKDNTETIETYKDFTEYIDRCISNKVISIDTETNNTLNTFDCKLMGLCLYTPGQKNAYIPTNHINRVTGNKLVSQVTEEQIKEQLSRLDGVFKIFHNATFDIEVIKTTCDIKLKADWDTMVGAQLIDENEPKGLKAQYKLHIDPDQDKYDIEHLFKGLPYEIFDPKLFALYAATDAYETYKLYEYQKKYFERPENKEVYDLFKTIEIPILDVVVDMELRGIEVDLDYAKRLSKVYHEKSDEVQERVDAELERIKPLIDAWRLTPEANDKGAPKGWKIEDRWFAGSGLSTATGIKRVFIDPEGKEHETLPDGRRGSKSKSEQLADPPELGSPTQMAIILYDVLKSPVVNPKTPRGTGADILKELANKVPLCKLLDEKRGYDILINTFIDKMPEVIQKDGRVHARFNTCGTATGRFSSSEPNLQNIPSHAKDIRGIFKATKGYSICGSDYSAQEPRSTATLSGDKNMIGAYEEGKDLYAVIASKCYHNDYWDNLEFNEKGVYQPDGANRRSKAKTILLGITYGMGSTTLAERMNLSKEEAEKIIEDFYKGFPGVKKLTDDSQQMLRTKGYVTDMFGRRRHIPDATLPRYDLKLVNKTSVFNPFLHSVSKLDSKTEQLINSYREELENATWKKDKDLIIDRAKKDGITVKDNNGFINRSLRQCLNARIQGTAASMTKLAMIMVHNDKELNDLGFKLLVTVHDEMFGECPTENSERCGERLCEVMVEAAKVRCSVVPWKCDPYIVKHWYADNLSAVVLKDYNKLVNGDREKGTDPIDPEIAMAKVKEKYSAVNPKYVEMMCNEKFDCNLYEDI